MQVSSVGWTGSLDDDVQLHLQVDAALHVILAGGGKLDRHHLVGLLLGGAEPEAIRLDVEVMEERVVVADGDGVAVLDRDRVGNELAPVLHDVETIDVHQVERRLTVELNDAADSLLGEGHLVDGEELEVHPLDSEQLRKELVFLCQLSKELNGTLEIDVIVETVTRSVLRKFEEADRVSFFFFDRRLRSTSA